VEESFNVIPAKAGIQMVIPHGERLHFVPAFVGMTDISIGEFGYDIQIL
jgi:hypothetical protein